MADTSDYEQEAGGRSLTATTTPPVPSSSIPTPDASSFTHTPYYCEENVYLLCKKLIAIGIADPVGLDLFVVLISNEAKKVPFWYQKAGQHPDGFVMWDYHVICVQSRRNKVNTPDLVWDLDTTLSFPLPLIKYVSDAVRPLSFGDSTYRRLFRIVHAPIFLRSFASDRSHMKDPSGNWFALPPNYEAIVAEDGTTNNLNEYIKMSTACLATPEYWTDDIYSNKYGVVVDETMLNEFFSRIHQ